VPLATNFYGGITSSQEELSEEGPADVSETYDELPPQEVDVLTKAKESESAAALYAAIVADEGTTNGALVSEKALKWPGQEEDEQEDAANLPPILKEATNIAKEVMKDENVELAIHLTNQFSGFVRKAVRDTVQWTAETSSEALHESVERAVALACGAKEATIETVIAYNGGGVLIKGIEVDNVRMEKVLLRVSNLPMLVAVLNTWKSKERQNLPLHLNSLRIHGMQVRNVNARSLQHAYSAFKNFPSKLSISEMVLANVKFELSPSGWSDNVAPERTAIHPWALPVVTLHRIDFTNVWNEMDAARMVGCITDISEPQNNNLLQGGKQPRRPASKALVEVNLQAGWRDEWRLEKAKEIYEAVAGLVKTAPLPIPESARPQLMKWEDVERLGMVLTEEAPHMLNTLTSPSGLKIIADIDTVVMLVQQGVPAGLLREGGETSVKIIETGVATAILERGSLIKEMTTRNILEPMISAGVLEVALERPHMIIDLINQGCISTLVTSGSVETIIQNKNLHVLKKLLRGEMLPALVYTGVMSDLVGDAPKAAPSLASTRYRY